MRMPWKLIWMGGLVVLVAALAVDGAMAQRGRDRDRDGGPEVGSRRDRDGGRRAEADRPGALRRGDRAETEKEATEEGMARAKVVPPDDERYGRFWAGRWRLGVYAYNTEKGVVITRVLPGSPAAREGLEPRDVIVTVDGYQVGYVGDLLYTLGEELQLRADHGGRVTLLVQNHRDDELLNLDVRLERHGWPVPRRRELEY